MGKLTIAQIERTKPPRDGSEVKLWDAAVAGLYLRVFSGGGRSWVFRYRADGGGRGAKLRSVKLGTYPGLSLDAAREAAKGLVGAIAKGQDPAIARRRLEATLGNLLAPGGRYEGALKARHLVKVKYVMFCLRRGLRHLDGVDVAKLTRVNLVEAFDRLQHLPGAQAELRKHTRGLLEWAVNNGLAHANVIAGLRLPPRTRAERLQQAARRRALTDPDIAALWRVATTQFGAMMRLAILTGMRRGELAALSWNNVRPDRIVLPADTTKNGKAHEIPLTEMMRGVLATQPKTTSPLVFPSHRTGRKLGAWHLPKVRLEHAADIGAWRPHDMRRTARSLMSRLGVAEPVAELAIGHAKQSLIGLYDLDEQWAARVAAFELVSAHIAGLVEVKDY